MKKSWWWLAGLGVVVPILLLLRKHEPPEVPVTLVTRQTIISNLPTNGRVEPLEWAPVRAETAGLISAVLVKDGQNVGRGAVIARLSQPGLDSQLAGARARAAQSKTALKVLQGGGQSEQLADLDADLAKAKFDRDYAQRDYDSLQRLEEKQAATHVEVLMAKQRLDAAELSIQNLGERRRALVSPNDVSSGEARVSEAQADEQSAAAKLTAGVVRTPIAGTVYSLPGRVGAYVNAGDLIANVGILDQLRVKVYVDEPELGRIRPGLPVRITWDGLPGKEWQGTVERLPTEIVSLGSRQVGEVWVTIANNRHDLVPGTTVNAEVRTAVVTGALTIPKAALRRDRGPVGVYVIRDGRIAWQPVMTGVSDVSNTSIQKGLQEGERVLLPTDTPIKDGDRVRPHLQ